MRYIVCAATAPFAGSFHGQKGGVCTAGIPLDHRGGLVRVSAFPAPSAPRVLDVVSVPVVRPVDDDRRETWRPVGEPEILAQLDHLPSGVGVQARTLTNELWKRRSLTWVRPRLPEVLWSSYDSAGRRRLRVTWVDDVGNTHNHHLRSWQHVLNGAHNWEEECARVREILRGDPLFLMGTMLKPYPNGWLLLEMFDLQKERKV